ncbi:hypothetical protein [Pseudoalteromonas sp. Of7M-16]|uniref:hypothetical protein n=1 Tax=Pseudoalteromonas sp. Of7M-16 TaxID=2917756 RepID=UPI001EF4BC4F|nr:hypothetical protein [Pseudoalteromonas sp. Of7M-16]MCG7551774.1 hypothetical protein [Pseudoalteromonas sp. Of7M-16]
MYYFNTTSTEDILDLEKSEVSMFDGYITDIRSIVFKAITHCPPALFKIENHITHPPIATQEFVDAVAESGLTGLIFEELT